MCFCFSADTRICGNGLRFLGYPSVCNGLIISEDTVRNKPEFVAKGIDTTDNVSLSINCQCSKCLV